MANKFHFGEGAFPSKGGAESKRGKPPASDLPERVANWPDTPGKTGKIDWGNTDPKVKVHPKSTI